MLFPPQKKGAKRLQFVERAKSSEEKRVRLLIQEFLNALGEKNRVNLLSCFSPKARVHSPSLKRKYLIKKGLHPTIYCKLVELEKLKTIKFEGVFTSLNRNKDTALATGTLTIIPKNQMGYKVGYQIRLRKTNEKWGIISIT